MARWIAVANGKLADGVSDFTAAPPSCDLQSFDLQPPILRSDHSRGISYPTCNQNNGDLGIQQTRTRQVRLPVLFPVNHGLNHSYS